MVDNERGTEGDADGFGGSRSDDDPVDLLADAEEEDTAAVVERLRESGPRQHVSAESVDDVLAELDGGGGVTDGSGGESDAGVEQDAEDRDPGTEESGGLVGGGPTTTVSQEGIDQVFEKLEAETADRGDGADGVANDAAVDGARTDDEPTADDADPTDAQSEGSSSDEEFGTLAGGGPTTTVSEESVDDVLSQVSDDVGYATFDGDDAPEIAADTEVDPDAVFPEDWGTADEDADAVPEPDEHSPDEDADDLRPDDDAVLDLFADVAEEVNEGSSSAESSDEPANPAGETDVDLIEAADGLFEDKSQDADPDWIADEFETADEFEVDDGPAATDDAEGEDADGLNPGLADEVDALLSAAEDVESGAESQTTVGSLDDAEAPEESGATSASPARQDASPQTEHDEEPSSDSSSRLASNASDDSGVEWSESNEDDEQAWVPLETSGSDASDSCDDGDTTPEESEADGDRRDDQSDDRSFAGLRYARAAAGWLRSLLARLT